MAALKGTGRTEGPTSLDKKYRNLLDILTFLHLHQGKQLGTLTLTLLQ